MNAPPGWCMNAIVAKIASIFPPSTNRGASNLPKLKATTVTSVKISLVLLEAIIASMHLVGKCGDLRTSTLEGLDRETTYGFRPSLGFMTVPLNNPGMFFEGRGVET